MRLRAGTEGDRTPYGFFALDRKSQKWTAYGTAADFSKAITIDGRTIDPEKFFYSRLGTDTIDFGVAVFKISRRQGKVVIDITGHENASYASDSIGEENSWKREYQFKYITGAKLWFDLRVFSDTRLFSEGIGWFDTSNNTFRIYGIKELGLRDQESVITRMNGRGDELWAGVSFCNQQTCLDDGGFVVIKPDSPEIQFNSSENSLLPPGAVLDLIPEGSLMWIVTSSGIVEWNPDKKRARKYAITDSAEIVGPPPLKFCPDGNPASIPFPENIRNVKLISAEQGGFVVSVKAKLTAWMSTASLGSSAETYDGNSELKIHPEQRITVFPSADAASKPVGEVCGGKNADGMKIIEMKNGWAEIDLSNNIWIPAENITLEIR